MATSVLMYRAGIWVVNTFLVVNTMNCNYCEWRCDLSAGHGVCERYLEKDKRIVEAEPFDWIEFYPYTIESMPFYHVLPDQYVIQTGTVSCNAKCCYCINAHLAIEKAHQPKLKHKNAQQFVDFVKQTESAGVVFAINEITCFIPSAFEIADLLHAEGLKCGCLTNAFQTEETAALLAEKMDFINVSLKSLSDDFYKKDLGLPSVAPVLRNIKIFNEKTHLEIVTPIVRELADGGIYEIMDFLYSVNPEMVWHLFRLMPNYKRADERDMGYEDMVAIYETARKKLPFTYLGNFAGSKWINTYCPDCGELLVKRISTGAWLGGTQQNNLVGNKCPHCGRIIPGVF